VFYVIGIAVVVGMASVLWWALKHGRTPFWFFGFANSRVERPILYWVQIISYAACMALVISVVGAIGLAAISN
jgi:hypothetical protein